MMHWRTGKTYLFANLTLISTLIFLLLCSRQNLSKITFLAPALSQHSNQPEEAVRKNAEQKLKRSDEIFLGRPWISLSLLKSALKTYRDIGDKNGEQKSLTRLGQTYRFLEDFEQSIVHYREALDIIESGQDPASNISDHLNALNNLGSAYLIKGKLKQAVQIHSVQLRLAQSVQGSLAKGLESDAYHSLGVAHMFSKNYVRADNYLRIAFDLAQQLSSRDSVEILSSLGYLKYYSGDLKTAGEILLYVLQYREARDVNFDISLSQSFEHSYKNRLQKITLSHGEDSPQFTETKQSMQNVIPQLRNFQRTNLEQLDLIRASIVENRDPTICSRLQTIYVERHQNNVALEIAERCRAAALARTLTARDNIDKAHAAYASFNIQQMRRVAEQQQATLVLYSVIADWQTSPPRIKPSESNLMIWVIQPTGEIIFRKVDLASRSKTGLRTLRQLISDTRESMGARGRASIQVSGVSKTENSSTNKQRLRELHDLLVEPIADTLPENPKNHVVFIPQGSLFSVPFPALLNSKGQYLIEKHTILSAPSVQTLELTKRRQQKIQQSPKPLKFLVVGNPVMPQLVPDSAQTPRALPSLPGAELEATSIASILDTQALLGRHATETEVRIQLPQARIIHFATHGWQDNLPNRFPAMNLIDPSTKEGEFAFKVPGTIALAPSKQDDGLLTASEISKLKLNAELVVLSACDTGQGQVLSEGVVGLARSLLVAGASSIIVSQWKVPDKPTAQLMTTFYKRLQQNPDKAQALRQAMLTVRKTYPNPVNWAAFTLIGEAR